MIHDLPDLYEPGVGVDAIDHARHTWIEAGTDHACSSILSPADVLTGAAALLAAAADELRDFAPDPNLTPHLPRALPNLEESPPPVATAEERLATAGAMVAAVLDRLAYVERVANVSIGRVELEELTAAHAFRLRDVSDVYAIERFLTALDPAVESSHYDGWHWEGFAASDEATAAIFEHAPHAVAALESVGCPLVGLDDTEVGR